MDGMDTGSGDITASAPGGRGRGARQSEPAGREIRVPALRPHALAEAALLGLAPRRGGQHQAAGLETQALHGRLALGPGRGRCGQCGLQVSLPDLAGAGAQQGGLALHL
jgi:hypothetical protein